MNDAIKKRLADIRVDTDNLYQETAFTDLATGTFRRLTPVKADGTPDPNRFTFFLVQTHLMTAAGPVPLDFRIDAATLAEAAEKFPEAAGKALEDMLKEIEEYRRQQSNLIVPGSAAGLGGLGGGSGLGGSGLGGGLGGPGGKIQFP